MQNKKTTIAGYLVLVGALLNVAVAVLNEGDIGAAVTESLLPALAGVGLISARDGAH